MSASLNIGRVQQAVEQVAKGHPVNTVHVFKVILTITSGRSWQIMRELGFEKKDVRKIRLELYPFPEDEAVRVVYEAGLRAAEEHSEYHEFLLLFMLQEILEDSDCAAHELLEETFMKSIELMIGVLNGYLHKKPLNPPGIAIVRRLQPLPFGSGDMLPVYADDLTLRASYGNLDPVIGRDVEIQQLIRILRNRRKNNPALVGDAGVGKTAVVEGLAQRLAFGEGIPPEMRGCRILSVNLTKVVAGTTYRGQFEERIEKLIKEIVQRDEVLLFIDEFHTIIGAGSAVGTLDASNVIKPYLARGELSLIGATTLSEYRRYIERDPAFKRRFKMVMVEEPDRDGAIAMVRGLVAGLERHHGIRIDDGAAVASVDMSMRYVQDGALPDKAIDLLDEAAGAVCTEDPLRRRRGSITAQDIGKMVRDWTGIRVVLSTHELGHSTRLETLLNEQVIGQPHAVREVVSFVNGVALPDKPVGSFMFLGPSGVGKTELAKRLAEQLFGSTDALVTLDMTQFSESFTVSRLIGSPPGYVGHDDGGQLTDAIRRRPYAVVLLDEIGKAHPDVFNLLLQVLDEGKITDSRGRVVRFNNTVIIMTTNIVAKQGIGFGAFTPEHTDQQMIDALTKHGFRKEFLNRIDGFIPFQPLDRESQAAILDLRVAELREMLLRQEGVELRFTHDAKRVLLEQGFDEQFGARPLARVLRAHVLNPLGALLKSGKAESGSALTIGTQKGKMHIQRKRRIRKNTLVEVGEVVKA